MSMNSPENIAPEITVPARSTMRRRTKVLLVFMFVVLSLLSWEYRILNFHRSSLARLQVEVQRRRNLQLSLPRSDVEQFLTGSPRKRSESGPSSFIDYYTWRGIIHHFHLRVESQVNGEVSEVEDSLLVETNTPQQDAIPASKSKPISAAEVDAALARAEKIFYTSRDSTAEFSESLCEVFNGLPEIKLSTIRGKPIWNSFRFPQRGRQLLAFRFTVPQAEPVELDFVRRMIFARYAGIISVSQVHGGKGAEYQEVMNSRSVDLVPNVEADGVETLDKALFGSISLKDRWPEKNFILWFYLGVYDEGQDFELNTVMFCSESGKTQLRLGANEVSDYIGLRTNIPRYASTSAGVRDAVTAIDQGLKSQIIGPASFRRILRPVIQALPELSVSTAPGHVVWQKLDFPHGPCTAVRFRIPDSIRGKADLYGAVLCTNPGQFGWDVPYGPYPFSRKLGEVELAAPLPQPPKRLTLFSEASGVLEPGQEIAIWFRETENQSSVPGPVYFTLTAVPHDDTGDDADFRRIHANQPWSCGKLLGVDVPAPAVQEGCYVLGWHEQKLSRLLMTPDSRRLVSVDVYGRVRIWDVESQQFEGQINLFYSQADSVILDSESQTLLAFDPAFRSVLRWNLDTRETAPSWEGFTSANRRLKVAAFGSQPDQFLAITSQLVTVARNSFEPEPQFVKRDLSTGQTTEHPLKLYREVHSLVCLPSTKMFAAGMSHLAKLGENQRLFSTASVQLWPDDLANLFRELPLGEFPVDYQGQEKNPVQLAFHPNGRRLAAICGRGILKVWDTGTWTELLSKTIEPKTDPTLWYTPPPMTSLLNVSLSADGETVATTAPDSDAVTVWNISDGSNQLKWKTDDVAITHVTHSSNGKWVATANTDGVIRLWKNSP
ncbi:MAG: hypothetical protein NT013_09845 [Planctomycetia bacterium]|nr:hypothetical protein [Planctomycetia bacterium]